MNDVMTSDLTMLLQRLQYQFKDPNLLLRALCHRSVGEENNERLEFLGDAVLSLVIANELFKRHPQAKEGDLSRMRSSLVNGEMLAHFAEDLQIGQHLRLGAGEQKSGGQYRHSILADALEAIIGAIYLDGGIDSVCTCILNWYGKRFDDLSELAPIKDAKSRLQEWLQARKYPLPTYEVKTSGRAHEQTFYVTCQVDGLAHKSEGESTSRRKAEQIAACRFLDLVL